MKKKALALLLTTAMVASLVGCGNSASTSNNSSADNADTSATDDAAADDAAADDAAADDAAADDSSSAADDSASAEDEEPITATMTRIQSRVHGCRQCVISSTQLIQTGI